MWFDAAGNQQHDDAGHSYTYDAEGKVLKVDGGSTATYLYDAMDNRVQVTTAAGGQQEYLFDPWGRRASGWAVSGNYGIEGRTWWGGMLIASRPRDGQTFFHFGDVLGTERVRTNYAGQVVNTQRSYAAGEAFSQSSTDGDGAAQDNNQFA